MKIRSCSGMSFECPIRSQKNGAILNSYVRSGIPSVYIRYNFGIIYRIIPNSLVNGERSEPENFLTYFGAMSEFSSEKNSVDQLSILSKKSFCFN